VKPTTYVHTVPSLRMSGVVSLLPLHTFKARTGTSLFSFINMWW